MRSFGFSGAAALALALLCASCESGGGGGGSGTGTGTGTGGSATAPPPPVLMAGASAVDVTPAPGTPLAGFGAQPRRVLDAITIPLHLIAIAGTCLDPDPSDAKTLFDEAQGTLDPIMARAVVISNGITKMGIVKVDAIGVTRDTHDDLAAFAATLGIPEQNFFVCATHTHSGPGAMSKAKLWQLIAADCYHDRTYQDFLRGCQAALAQADAALRPAEVGIGVTQVTNASRNRRGRPGIYDTDMGVIKVVEKGSGAPIAAILHFAVHGTALGASNMMFSADVMGVAEREVEQGLGGGVAVFLNGAEGDVAPEGGLGAGTTLAQAYVAAWPGVATKDWVEVGGASEIVQLPPPTFNSGCIPIPGTNDTICTFLPGFSLAIPLDPSWLATDAPFKAVRLDRSVSATIPGEPITEIGWDVKARAVQKGFERAFVVGLANEHLGYLTTRAEYMRGEYEATATLYGVTTGEVAVQAADRLMDRVKP